MKIGYKGFDKNLKCRDEQFELGKVYTKPEKDRPRTCSSDGYHYCNNLKDVFNHYSKDSGNRFFEIEILGNFSDSGEKSVTTSFKILKEITELVYEEDLEDNMKLESVKQLQTQYPLVHVGGSIGLFLHGIRLKRFYRNESDIDLVSPYFILFEDFGDNQIDYINGKKSSNDFDDNFIFNDVKVDCRIDPKQRYEIIEYKGFKYKVSQFEVIMAAKVKYAGFGQKKHKDDIREMCKVNAPQPKQRPVPVFDSNSIPF